MSWAFGNEGPKSAGGTTRDGECLGPLVAALAGAAHFAIGNTGAGHNEHVAVATYEEL